MNLVEKAKSSLRGVIDPETKQNVLDMGLIRDLSASEEGLVKLKLRPASLLCPLAFKLAFDTYKTLEKVEGVKKVELEVIDCVYASQINEVIQSGEPILPEV